MTGVRGQSRMPDVVARPSALLGFPPCAKQCTLEPRRVPFRRARDRSVAMKRLRCLPHEWSFRVPDQNRHLDKQEDGDRNLHGVVTNAEDLLDPFRRVMGLQSGDQLPNPRTNSAFRTKWCACSRIRMQE